VLRQRLARLPSPWQAALPGVGQSRDRAPSPSTRIKKTLKFCPRKGFEGLIVYQIPEG